MKFKKYVSVVSVYFLVFIWALVLGGAVSWYLICRTSLFSGVTRPVNSENLTREEYDLLLVSKDTPRKLIYLDYYKSANEGYGNVYLYDGSTWTHQQITADDSVSIKPENSLNQSEYKVETDIRGYAPRVRISVPQIFAHMTIRGKKAYSKFGGALSAPSAKVSLDDKNFDCFAAMLVGYNSVPDEKDWMKLGVKTDWLMYFDKDWNFYHLDKTTVEKPSPLYESHSFFSEITGSHKVVYHPEFSVTKSGSNLKLDAESLSLLNLSLTHEFDRKEYLGTSYGALAEGADDGVGVYLNLNTQ